MVNLFEREEVLRKLHQADVVLIRCGAFYEAYGESAKNLAQITGYKVGSVSRGGVISEITGCPDHPSVIERVIRSIEDQAKRVVVVQQVAPNSPKVREVAYVTGSDQYNLNTLLNAINVHIAIEKNDPQLKNVRELREQLNAALAPISKTKGLFWLDPKRFELPAGYDQWVKRVIDIQRQIDLDAGLSPRDEDEVKELYSLNVSAWLALGRFTDGRLGAQRRVNIVDWREND
jgi:hypothetical protein